MKWLWTLLVFGLGWWIGEASDDGVHLEVVKTTYDEMGRESQRVVKSYVQKYCVPMESDDEH